MSEPSPRPWRVEQNVIGWHSFIVDANGDGVAACWRTARGDDEKEQQYDEANAALIVDAVNERDRLRDIVKRMIPFVEKCHSDALDLSKTIKGICALKGVDTSEIDRINSEHDALLREARAAIGKDKG